MSKKAQAARPSSGKRSPEFVSLAIPPALALLLVIPGFAFTYFFDDYDFLGRAQAMRWADLLPDPQSLFYRPISRELYFGLINLLGPAGLLAGHVLNALLFGLAVILLCRFTSELAGPRAGFFAGLAFAVFGQMPLLAGWVSGGQDLLAICFILAALSLRLRGRRLIALVAILLAILSKETAIAFVPILLGIDFILGRSKTVPVREIAAYGASLAAWAGIHPGIRSLLAPAAGPSSSAYVGLVQAHLLGPLESTAATILNLPLTGGATPWPTGLNLVLFGGVLISVWGAWWISKARFPKPRNPLPPVACVAALGLCVMVLPALLTSLVVRDWLPYYACIPAMGASLLAGLALGRWPITGAAAAVVIYLWLGIWCRGMMIDPTVTTERTLAGSSDALRRVEAGFKRLWPTFPRHANVYVSTQVAGTQNVYVHLNRYQPLRVWYRDPTILTLTPRRRATTTGPEFLAWISPSLDVYGVDPVNLEPLTSGPKPELTEYQQTLRSYARGLADAGQADRAVTIMLGLPQIDSVTAAYDRRYAAMYLFANGRDSEALQLLSTAPPIDSLEAAPTIADLMLDKTVKRDLDPFMMRAFGIRGTLPDLYRTYMRFFEAHRNADPARELARKLETVEPGNRESADALRRLGSGRHADRITTPAVQDSI